jgi:hypothetical protein
VFLPQSRKQRKQERQIPEQGRQQDDLDARVNSCGAKERSLTQENFQKEFESY